MSIELELRRPALVPNSILGVSLFLFTEVMLFAGLIASYVVLRSQAEIWPPADQARLPLLATAFNTALLIASGVTMWFAVRAMQAGREKRCYRLLIATCALGTAFLGLQGVEWVSLIGYGMTSSSSLFGSLFYTIVGCHALHVIVAVAALGLVIRKTKLGGYTQANSAGLVAMRLYWGFVVLVWPPLYGVVYLW